MASVASQVTAIYFTYYMNNILYDDIVGDNSTFGISNTIIWKI